MRLPESHKLVLFAIAVGTLQDKNVVGGVDQATRIAVVSDLLKSQDDHGMPGFSLREVNGQSEHKQLKTDE